MDTFQVLSSDMEKLLLSGTNADVKLRIEDKDKIKTILAHKIILTSRNEYFKKFFEYDIRKWKDHVVPILGYSAKAFETFIKFLYTAKIEKENITLELLVISDRFLEFKLRDICQQNLVSHITIDNVINTLLTASQCNCDLLKGVAAKFIAKNYAVVTKSPEFDLIFADKSAVKSIFDNFNLLLNA